MWGWWGFEVSCFVWGLVCGVWGSSFFLAFGGSSLQKIEGVVRWATNPRGVCFAFMWVVLGGCLPASRFDAWAN